MKITCQSCQSKYTVSDDKVQGKTVKIKCRKCGATIIVNSSGGAGNGIADPVSTSGGADGSYMVNVADGDQRTMSVGELVTAYNDGTINAETFIWADGMADWQPLSQVESVVAALNSTAEAVPEPAPEPSPQPSAAEAPRAAAVRRDPARKSQDLFGGGMAAQQTARADVATSAPLFSAGNAAPTTGQRDENSTLFSLSALTAKTATASAPSRGTATKEDSGLIDLRALADAGPAPAPSAMMVDAGLFPLGAPIAAAPAVPVAGPGSIPAPPAKKSPLVLILAGLVGVLLLVVVFFVVKSGGEKPAPSVDPSAAAAPAPTPTATAAATPSATATASASASAEASASPSASAVAKAGKGGGRGGARPGKGGAEAPAAPAAPAAAPKSACGCAPGDLMCAMKCSAGKH